jgi:hypothetical protein
MTGETPIHVSLCSSTASGSTMRAGASDEDPRVDLFVGHLGRAGRDCAAGVRADEHTPPARRPATSEPPRAKEGSTR